MPDSINLYYFRDKSGKRHSVWKSDFDADPQGFAKAYPDARMEVINRKTGDRGHVAVGDVAAAGKEGFNLFTCRGYQKEHYNKSKVQQIAQKVGADYLSRPKNQMGKAPSAAPKNASPFVKSLYETDNAMKGADYPIDYTSTKAVQQVNQRNQQVKTEASRTAAKQNEWTRQNKPMVNNGTVGVMKTQGQFEKDIDDSAKALVGSNFDVDIDNAIDAAFENAHKVGIENIQSEMYPRGTAGMDSWISQRKYNQANDPEKILGDLTNNLKAGIDNMLSNPQTKRRILSEASRLEIDPESYIRNSVAPSIIERASERFDKSMLKRMLPNGSLEYIVGGICDSMVGTILGDLTTTRGQKEYRQRALQATRDGQNPNFKPTVWDEAGRGAVSFLTDAPAFGVAGKGAAFATNKVFGNAAQQAITAANQSAFARFGTGIAKGILHGGVTGFQYGAMNGAVQNFSTGEDTSFGATFKAALLGGASEAASFAAMEGMGGAVGALGHKIGFNGGEKGFWQGAKAAGKKISFEAVKTGFEGLGMATGGVVSGKVRSALTGEDSEGFTVEGTLESCASAAIFKLMHAKDVFGKEYGRNGKKLGFKDSVIQKTARFFASDALKSSSNVFSTEETAQLMNAGKSVGMEPLKNIIDLAKRSKKVNPNDAERGEDGSDVLNYYQQIMQDPTVSWDAKAKFTTLVMGTMPESRPMMGYLTMSKEKIGGNEAGYRRYVNEYSDKGELLSKQEYDSIEKRGRIFYLRKMVRENQRFLNSLGVLNTIDKGDYNLQNEFFKSKAKNMEEVQDILDGMNTQGSKIDYEYSIFVLERGNVMKMIESVASRYGMSKDALIKAAFDKNTLHRTDNEQQAIVQLRKECERIAFPKNKAHAEQSQIEGKDVAEENGLGSDTPNQEAVTNELRNLSSAEDALQEMMDSNDIFKETYEGLKKQGLTNPQIYDAMIQQNGLTEEQLEPFAKYINANARVQGMQQATQEAIEQHVESVADDWAFHGTMDGKKADGVQMLYVKDNNGRTLIVGSGDVAYDPTTGRPKEDVGDMLVCLDVQTRQPVYVKVEDTTLDQMQDVESFKNEERQRLQNINAAPYNQAAQEQAMKDAAKPQPKEEKTQQQEDAANNNQSEQPEDSASAEGGTQQEQAPSTEQEKPSRKFSDGTDVPMVKDSKGRPTPDYANMKPEQAAEILSADFGDNAEKVVDGQIKKAEKAVKDAEKIKVNYEGEPNDILEQENLKKQTVDAANKQLEHAKAIKKAMTAKKVAETVSKEEKHTEGANQAGSVAAQKFQDAPRLVGNKRSRTLPNNEKINGHYEIVPAESLTPSHDATNGYKKSDGFPVDAEGRTTNDRDYENDKAAQQSTDQIALKYNGQAIEQVPVVSDEGIVYDGNGRTMAGQKAAKEGTDGEYISELLDNAENFGFTREQIEKSGIEHPRLVLVTDERMPYTTETFAKFNRNEKKAQNNTEQAVAKSKTLSPEDVGAIVAEIEGNGSLEAFFNNPNAISSLWKTLQEKGIIGQNEVAGLQDMPGVPNAQGKEFIKNLVLGAMFKPETIRMMGIDGTIKNKVINGIRAIMDNSKLGDYALSDEIEGAIRLLYEARRNKMKVDDLLSQSNFADGNARDRFSEISQALAQTLEGKVSIFRDLISEYNKDAIGNGLKHKDAKEQSFGGEFGEVLDKDALIKEFLETAKIIKQNNIKLYGEETRRESSDVPSGNEEHSEETGRGTGEEKPAESAESQQRVTEPEEKSEPITITTEHGGEKYFPGGIVDLAKKIISENPEKPITHLQRGLRIDYEAATALAKELGWQDPNEKIKILPKEDGSPSNPSNPLQSLAKAADDFKREHPMTEKEIMEVDGLDDEAKYTAIDYLNGEDDSEIARICYEQAYNKRSAKRTASGGKNTAPTSPMDALKKAAAEYSEPKVETAKPKTIAEKKAAAKKLKEENDKKTQDLMNQFLAAKDEKKNGSGKALSTLIPIPSKALKWMDRNLTLTDKQKELLPQLLSAIKGSMYARIKEGIYNLEDVIENVRKDFKTFFDSLDKDDANKILAEAAYKGRFTDPETGERIKLSDAVERERKLSPEHQDKLVGDSKTAEERKQKENSFISNLKMVMGSRKVDGIRELRQLAKELGLEGVKDTDLQELAETAVVSRARDIAASKAMSPERKFAEIRKLYENQPSLNQRDSDRVEKQQYSTPAPYAYLADMYVKGNGKEIKSALEPSAGNGMLTIGLPMDKVHVNDIDEARLLNLHRQGFKNITSQDGTQPFADKDVDVVVTNPPFGTATPKEYDGYKISSLEGQMAINALESMKDDGRAAIIIGGKTEYAKNGSLNPKDKAFLGYLYSHYNVEDVINVDGSLYAKQGTTYPTRIILINGRRAYDPENKVYPPVQKEARAEAVKDYDELYKRINDDILRSRQQPAGVLNEQGGEGERVRTDSDVHESNEKVLRGAEQGGREGDTTSGGGDIRGNEQPSETSVPELGSGENTNGEGTSQTSGGTSVRDGRGNVSPRQNDGRKNDTSGAKPMGEGNRGGRPNSSGVSGRGDNTVGVSEQSPARGVGLKETPKRELNTEKVKYVSQSSNPFSLNSVVPADQAKVTKKALDKIGDVDEFLVSELGYNDKEDMYHALGSEQADSVALAIHQAKQGNAFIIGDMTGIGKGRQAAAMIRYAYKSGKIPVFITAKKDLFSDMYRDLKSIGNAELRPFIWAAKDKDNSADMLDSEGNLVYKRTSDAEQKRVMAFLQKYGKLPEGYDYIVTTYDSFNGGTMDYENGKKTARKDGKGSKNGQAKRDLLEVIAKNANVIMDESHKAGGNGGGSSYLQYIVPKLNAITFLSATYAKRPENMPIYALRTSMNQAGVEPAELIDAIKRGGTTLQEIMSQSLAASGQFIRRERDMTGVTIDWKAIEDPVVVQEQREQYDKIIGLFNDIIDFQRTYVNSYIDQRNEDISKTQGSIKNKQGTADLGIKNTPFASRTYNMVQQVLLSLKAREAAKSAIEHLKNGEKVVIALNNTNESQTGEYAEGVEMEAPDLGVVLKKGLNGVLRYEQSDDMDNKTYGYFDVDELGPEAAARYREIEDSINNASTGLSLSPIDVIRDELEDAGYKVGELTGRTYQLARNPNGTVSKVKRTNTDKKKLALDFNTDKLDVLILNRSASTGISLHDSKDFNVKEHKPRTMIVVQQQADVNEEVQMRGRIDRTGQVNRGRYEYIVSQIPSEQRLLMMFKSKLRSLDANTTSSQKSKFNDMEVNDIINKYGDKVVKEYMADHLDLYAKMADPFGWEKAFGADLSTIDTQKLIGTSDGKVGDKEAGADASKLLGRMALLKVAEQEKMLAEIGELYKNEINRLNEMSENDLEITELPLKAKTIGKEVWKEGSEPNGDNAFADNTYIEKVNMAILKKPMKGEEVKKAQEGLTGGRSWDEYKEEKKSALKEYFVKKFNDEKVRLDERAKKIAQKAADKYNKEAKKNQEKNQLTDEQIEKNTQFQYDNVYKEEKAKADTALKNIKTKYQAFDRVLDTFNTNEAYVLPTDMNNPNEMSAFGNSYGRLIDIKITDNYSPTASTISFATLDGRRKITFPIHGLVGSGDKRTDVISTICRLTKQAEAMDDKNYRVVNKSIDNWDRMISNESRKDGYIITGNLMQALIDTKAQGLGGQLVKYTTDNGEVKTGILMPDRFKPTDAATEKVISSKADDFMSGKTTDIISSDGEVRLISVSNWKGTTIELRVPKSKAKGGKYYLDEKLRSLADDNDFYTNGGSMVANIQPENVRGVLDRLSSLGVKVREERKEGTHFRTEENSGNGESSEKLFLSLQSDKSNNKKEHYDTVTELANRVKQGTARIVREGEEAESGRSVDRRESIPAIAGRILNAANKQSDGQSGSLVGEASEQQGEKVLRFNTLYGQIEDWAKENGCYFTEEEIAKDSLNGRVWNDEGAESTIYRSKDGKSVIKVMSIDNYYDSPMDYYLDRNKYFNEAFPDTAIEVVGYGRDNDGRPAVIYKQPLVEGETVIEHFKGDEDAANSYIDKYLSDMGYNKKVVHDEWGGESDSNGKFNLFDVNYSNVIIDKGGKPHVIDAEVLPIDYKEGESVEIKDADSAKFRSDNTSVSIADDAPIVVKHVDNLSKKLGSNVNMVNSPEEVTNPAVKERLEKGENVTGWYDEKTGEVHLYMPNIHDRYTAEKTIWHEVVGHKGMRGLFGDKFNDFLRSIYYDLDKPENAALKKLVDEERKYNPLNIYDSIEEGIARLAEDGKGEVGFWNTIKNKVTDLLHEIGYRIAPNTKDVKYLLWLSKNLQKNPNSPYWKLRANAVRERLNREKPSVTDSEGMFFGDGKARDLESMPKKEYLEATDGQIHFRTTPSAATAIDRYHRALNAHGYMFTESYMDNMLPLKKLMQAIRPDNKKIEDINASENPYVLQNTMQGAMSNEAKKFEDNIMEPLSKAMAGVLDAFDGKKEDDKIRNCNLYLIKKHGLERNRVFYVRDHIDSLKKDEATKQDATNLQNDWNTLKNDLGDQLRRNAIRLDEYYSKMDEWIRDNIDKEFNPGDNDYSGFHGIYGLDNADAYDDASVIAEVMDSEANMESVKKGSVTDFWNKINTATQYSLDSDYKNGLVTKDNHDNVSAMFDWYVPLRKFDETTAEDVYGYITEKGDPSSFIGPTLMKAKGRESLSETNILAQIGAIGNSAISRGGKNAIKQAFARFVRNNGGQGLVTEMNTWVELDGYDTNNKPIWKEALPQIPEDATPDEVAKIVSDFENDMQSKKAKGEAINITNRGRIGFKFERAKDKSQHIVDVMIAGKKHSFVINGNPRAAQALNGLLENSKATGFRKVYSSISRFVAQTCTSYNPEFVARNIVRDFEFALANVSAKEDARYRHLFEKYYAGLIPINGAKSISIKDLSGSNGFGLFAKYRNGTLDLSNKVERYFKEFMENGGETGWVQIKNMKGWEKQYKSDIKTERSGARKAGKMLKDFFFGNLENINEVAENQARFAVFCASRDYGRSAVRSAYDAKQVSTNFNRHGSGDAINSFKNGELGTMKSFERGLIGFTSSYLRHCSMFFNAGIQSTNLLLENVKNAKLGTVGFMAAEPFALGALAALLNNCLIASEDEKDRKGVKDPYGELPDYIRRNNLCIYKGNGEFVTIPLAIELRAFYGLGDMAAGLTFSPNVSGQKNAALDAVGCVSQLVPVFDYLGNSSAGKAPAAEFFKAIAPSALSPLIEWGFNSDWKGSPIERRGDFYDNSPAWERAYSGTPEFLKEINKYANAQTNDVAKGNEKMLGNKFLDAITNPSGINHFFGGVGGGAATFTLRSIGLAKNAIKGEEVETKDVPFVHSFFYTPTEQSSMQRTKSKWYNYVDDMETTIENVKSLKSKSVSPLERLKNAADYLKFQNSSDAEKVRIIEQAKKQMKKWQNMKKKSDDNESIKFADQNIDLIMQKTVDELDKLN